VTHTVVLLASGLLPEHLGLPGLEPNDRLPFPPRAEASRVPIAQKLWAYGCPTRAPGDQRRLHSVMGTLLRSPLPDALKRKREGEIKKLSDSFVKGRDSTPLLYVLTPDEMALNAYRLPSYVEAGAHVFIPGDVPARDAEILAKARESGEVDESAGDVAVAARDRSKIVEVNEAGQRTRGNVRADEGWVETPAAQGPPPGGDYPILAIDCEMVRASCGACG
jgi:RNA exonuclease 1